MERKRRRKGGEKKEAKEEEEEEENGEGEKSNRIITTIFCFQVRNYSLIFPAFLFIIRKGKGV